MMSTFTFSIMYFLLSVSVHSILSFFSVILQTSNKTSEEIWISEWRLPFVKFWTGSLFSASLNLFPLTKNLKMIFHILWSSHQDNKKPRRSTCFSISRYIEYSNNSATVLKRKTFICISVVAAAASSAVRLSKLLPAQTDPSGCFPEEPLVPRTAVPAGTRLIVAPQSINMTRRAPSSEEEEEEGGNGWQMTLMSLSDVGVTPTQAVVVYRGVEMRSDAPKKTKTQIRLRD